jgi:hypothetical protein
MDAGHERHYTVQEIADLLNLSRDSVRRIFLDEPGVLVLSRPHSRHHRSYRTIRIPGSVLNRVYRRLTSQPSWHLAQSSGERSR